MEVPSLPLHSVCFGRDSVNIHAIGLCVKGSLGQQPTGLGTLNVLVPHLHRDPGRGSTVTHLYPRATQWPACTHTAGQQ